MAISDHGNLSNIVYLLETGGVKVLRKVFLKRVDELKPDTEDPETWTVDKFLNMNKEKIKSAKLTPESKLIIFPVGGKQTNLDLWDFLLFFYILKATCSLSAGMQLNMLRLKKIHKKIAYFEDLDITDDKYKNYFDKLRYIFENTLDELNDMALQENIREMLQKSYARQIPKDELSKALLARQRYCDERKDIVKAKDCETRQLLEIGNRELLAILAELQENLTSRNCEYTGNTIPVKIKTSQPDMENHLSDVLVEMFNNEIKDLHSLRYSADDEEIMRYSVHKFCKSLEEKGYQIVKAEQGCILLHIQCSSVASLISFYIEYLRGDLDKYLHVDCLQEVSRDFLRYQELQLEIVLYKDDFQQALSNIQENIDWTRKRRLPGRLDSDRMELFETDENITSILLTVKPPLHFKGVDLEQIILPELERLNRNLAFTLKRSKSTFSENDEETPKKLKRNGKKLKSLRVRTDEYPDETERYDCIQTGNEKILRHFIVPSETYRRFYYTNNNAQQIAKKYEHIVNAFGLSNEFALPCFEEVNIFFFSGDTSVDLSVVDDAHSENVKELKVTFDSIEEIATEIIRPKQNAVSVFISTRDFAGHMDYNRFNPHIILVDENELKSFRSEEMKNVKKSSRRELAKTISSILEDVLFQQLGKMIEVLEDIVEVHGPSSTRQESSVRNSISTDVHSEKENHGYGSQSNATVDLKKAPSEAQELYEDTLALFYRTGKPWKTAFEDMVKTLDKKIAKEIMQVNGVTSVGYKLDVLHLFLDDSMGIEGRQLTENRLKRLLEKHRIARYEFHYEQGKLEQYAEVGSVLKAGERAGALGCFAKLGKREEMCVLFSKHVSLGGNSLLVEDPPISGMFMRFATLISSNTQDSDPLDIAIAKVLKEPESCQVLFKDEFGKCMPSIVCLFDNTIWLNRLPVHISRAAGSPGLGIIIIPVLDMETAQDMYLKIEDRDVNNRFAHPGDSGAIVCANDFRDGSKVHVIAMLIGSSNEDEVNQSSKTKRQYVAFRLIQGVMQLERELKEDINLY